MNRDIRFMKKAIAIAKKAYEKDEIPVGAIVVRGDKIIAQAYNCKKYSNKVSDHAEIIAMNKAGKKLNDWRLIDCEIYVTMEPCPMCASAIQQSRIKRVIIGTRNTNKVNATIVKKIFSLSGGLEVVDGIEDTECNKMMNSFFKYIRDRE